MVAVVVLEQEIVDGGSGKSKDGVVLMEFHQLMGLQSPAWNSSAMAS